MMNTRHLMGLVLTVAMAPSLHASQIAFDEAVDGDLNHVTGSVRNIGTLDLGVNTITGVLDNAVANQDLFDPGYFSLPAGLIITSATVEVTGISGIFNKLFFLVDTENQQVGNLLFNAIGTQSFNPGDFPLTTAGDYEFLTRNQGGANAGESVSYQWTITVDQAPSEVPEPPTLLLAIGGLMLLWRALGCVSRSLDLGRECHLRLC